MQLHELNSFRYVQCSVTTYDEFYNHVYVGMFFADDNQVCLG